MEECYGRAVNVCFTQMSAKKKMQTYVEKEFVEVRKEYKQLEILTKLSVEYPYALLKDKKRKALLVLSGHALLNRQKYG